MEKDRILKLRIPQKDKVAALRLARYGGWGTVSHMVRELIRKELRRNGGRG